MPPVDLFRALPVNGKSIALIISVSMHAAVAIAAAQSPSHAASNANPLRDRWVDLAALELSVAELPVAPLATPESAPAPAPASHHHDYPVPASHDAIAHDPSIRHVLPASSPSHSPTAAEAETAAASAAAAPVTLDSTAPATPRFVMTVGSNARARLGTTTGAGLGEGAAEGSSATPAAEASVDTPAKLLAGGTPSYTHEAESAGIEADVPLEIIVDAAGSVVGARALSRVGYGLDEAALRSVRGYRFSPARRGGKALAVRMRWLMRFQLR